MPSRVFFSFPFRSLVCFVGSGDSNLENKPREGSKWTALAVRACICGRWTALLAWIYVYACEMAPLAETDRSTLFLNFSHAHGRQEVSTADYPPPLALPVHMYKYVALWSCDATCRPFFSLRLFWLHNRIRITRILWDKVMKVQENTHYYSQPSRTRIDIFKPGTPRCRLSDVLVR